MSADVAHELRTPLTALQACLEEVRDGLVPADPPTLSALHDQAVRLGRIVNDLSDLAQAESPSFELRPERMDLADLASDTLMVWRPRIEEAGLTLRTSLQMGTMVSIDSDRMGQVMTNLLSNAVRYSSPGDSITVEVRAADDEAILMISDTGPGMSPEDLPRVRTHSYRGADQRAKPGSGIGLAVVGLLVEAHGGEMDIASKVDHGTTVVVRLPRSR
jgi:two-component system sensor histidine kinase BaeS